MLLVLTCYLCNVYVFVVVVELTAGEGGDYGRGNKRQSIIQLINKKKRYCYRRVYALVRTVFFFFEALCGKACCFLQDFFFMGFCAVCDCTCFVILVVFLHLHLLRKRNARVVEEKERQTESEEEEKE